MEQMPSVNVPRPSAERAFPARLVSAWRRGDGGGAGAGRAAASGGAGPAAGYEAAAGTPGPTNFSGA